MFVIYQQHPAQAPWRQLEGKEWVILSFADEEWEERFLADCRENGVRVQKVLRAADYIDQASLIARVKYMEFVSEWPETLQRNSRNFKQTFTYKGEIAYWWLSSASFKDNEISTTFEYLCHLEVVQQVLKNSDFSRCTLLTNDKQIALLIARCCGQLNLQFMASGDLNERKDSAVIRGLLGQLKFIVFLSLSLVFGRVALRGPQHHAKGAGVAFLTVYPDALDLKGDGPKEANYRALPENLASWGGMEATLLAVNSSGTPRGWFRLWTLRKLLSRPQHPRVVFLDSFLRPSDVCVALWNFFFFVRYLWMDQTDRRFRDSFMYDGINVYELVGKEFRRSFLNSQIPTYLVLARVAERAVRAEGFQYLVCFLELYPLARAMYYGSKRGNPNITTVAFQHANINRMKLWYSYRAEELIPLADDPNRFIATMPIPDRYIFQGRNGMEILKESGYPADRCILTGSPRYDGLADLVQRSCKRPESLTGSPQPSQKTNVLVLPSLSPDDAKELIHATVRACNDSSQYTILVKPHPRCPVNHYVQSTKARYKPVDIQVVDGNLHTLIQGADVIVTSYSTTGDEAIALGRPVICYAGLRPCGATFLDIEAAPLAHSAGELRHALYSMIHDEAYRRKYQARWADLVEGSFYCLDGRAAERIVEVLASGEVEPSY